MPTTCFKTNTEENSLNNDSKMKTLFTLIAGLAITITICAQPPQSFNYQAAARDASGQVKADTEVELRLDIRQGSTTGSVVYSETFSVTTNTFGLLNVQIGEGTVNSGSFADIDWSNDDYFLETVIDGTVMGVTQLLSVPYSMHAGTADRFTGNKIKNLADPADPQDAATKAYVDQQITHPGVRISAMVDSIFCFGENSGSIDITISGGTPPYYIEWDDGTVSEDLVNIPNGRYQVYVEDSNGVTAFRHFRLNSPDEIIIEYTVTQGSGSIDISVSGGSPPYTYVWSNGSTSEDLTGVADGVYTVDVTDDYGCTVSEEIELMGFESELLAEYLESGNNPAGNNYINTYVPRIISATDLHTLNSAGQVYIVDLRLPGDYDGGHIPNAVNVAASDVVDHLEANDVSGYDKIALVCYTGQVSNWVNTLVHLSGFTNSYALLWGMASWHSDFANPWNSSVSNVYYNLFETTANTKDPEGDLPELMTGYSDAQSILDARITEILAEGFSPATITASLVFDNPSDYYIMNYWPEAEYLDPGHIPGAIQYTPKQDLSLTTALRTLPADKTIAVYGYTGMATSAVVACLRLLGYDAKVILFGANGMIHDYMTKAKWSASLIQDYDYTMSK
jgi:rhodanese-related sulfurtransferase